MLRPFVKIATASPNPNNTSSAFSKVICRPDKNAKSSWITGCFRDKARVLLCQVKLCSWRVTVISLVRKWANLAKSLQDCGLVGLYGACSSLAQAVTASVLDLQAQVNRQVEKFGQPSGLELSKLSTGREKCYAPPQTLVC